MSTHDTNHGRSVEDVVEGQAGSALACALTLAELQSVVETTAETFRYDDEPLAATLVEFCDELSLHLSRLSMREDGGLTLKRECRRCSGHGSTTGENPCVECDGSGSYVPGHGDDVA